MALALISACSSAADVPTTTSDDEQRWEEPSASRAIEDLEVLAGEIGPRVAGSDAERRAADYIAARLEAAGYLVTVESFEIEQLVDRSMVRIADRELTALALNGSPNLEATGSIVAVGIGRPADFRDNDVAGAIVLIDRGVIPFEVKARRAEAAGALAVVIVNNEPGIVRGDLGNADIGIPVITVARRDGDELRSLDAAATLTVIAERRVETGTSQNVVARASDDGCRAYLGAHYDSAPFVAGANDNASGTALMIELARTHRHPGLCVIAFGAEEIGLVGSRAYVAAHRDEVLTAGFMLNFDVVGAIDDPRFIGDRELAEFASDAASAVGERIPVGQFPPFASSDHVSFSDAGVPAITVTGGDDPDLHTPADNLGNISEADFARMLDSAVALLRALLDSGLEL